MSTKTELERDEVMAQLDTLIRESVAQHPRLSKALPEDFNLDIELPEDEDVLDPDGFPKTRAGLDAFVSSPAMQDLARTDEAAFRQAYVDFALTVVGAGAMTPVEFGVETKKLDQLIAMAGGALAKAVELPRMRPTPWQHARTLKGLVDFAKSTAK